MVVPNISDRSILRVRFGGVLLIIASKRLITQNIQNLNILFELRVKKEDIKIEERVLNIKFFIIVENL